ncbi:hypothetical protein COCOBI_15-1570 [Coccomyxa sp. Obi]|nr:hypothetical protein COCOBI_15-1570 [Coccomyxa sp. Obi]
MGQHRANAPKASVTREPITPPIMQRLVAAVADINSTRLKIIAGRYNKQDIVSVTEPTSRLNLLQIGVVMNNVAAVQFLLSIGASKSVLWDPLDGTEKSWDLSYYMPPRVFNDFQNFTENLASPNVAQDAFEYSGLSLLHIAALAGHKEMVRFLVEQAGIPVDVRAAVTGATPLLTAITRKCVRKLGPKGAPTHVCGIPASHEDASGVTCTPMLPIVQLLLELGADLGAVDNSGACMLATAAESGRYGMLHDLLVHVPQVMDCCPKHAGHLLYGTVSNWVRTGIVDAELDIFKLLKKRDTDLRRSGHFWKEILAPIKRRKSAVVDRVLKVLPGAELMVTHTLCMVMIGKSSNRYSAMKYLIKQGVPISALRLGQEHYTVTGHCDVDMLGLIVGALTEVHGPMHLEQHFDILFGLWADSYLHPFEPCPELLATRQLVTEKCVTLFNGSGRISDQSLWSTRFSPELCERFDFCALGKPVSPLVLAAAGDVPGAVRTFTKELMRTWPAGVPNPKLEAFLNQPDPCGRLPLIEAIVRNRAMEVDQLLACGADLTVADGLGRMALHEVARLGKSAREMGLMCLDSLQSRDVETHSRVVNSVATCTDNQRRFTLAEVICFMDAWYMLPQLVQLGMDVQWTPDEERRGKLLIAAVILHADLVEPAFLTGPSLPAALTAVDERTKLSALALALNGGNWKWSKPLLDACRREGVDPDDLLRWHARTSSEAPFPVPMLFYFLGQHGEAVVHLMEAGFNLGPHIIHCIPVPLHFLCGSVGEDGAPLPDVTEKCSLLMWAAAFGQLVAVEALLHLGMDPNFQLTHNGAWVPTAISAALDRPGSFPDLVDLSEIPLENKLECILELLQWKAAITESQLRQIVQMMYKAHHSRVAKQLWAFLQRKAAACAACGLIGDWRTCAHCKASFYCSRACQHSHWLQHRGTCQQRACGKNMQDKEGAALHAVQKPDSQLYHSL